MPKGGGSRASGGGGAVANAFAAQYGAVPSSVKMSYIGKDKNGNSIYKFMYQVRKTSGAIATSRGMTAPSTTVGATRTVAVGRNRGAWLFAAPGSKSLVAPIASSSGVDFGISGARQDLVNRSITKLGDLISRGLLTPEQAKTFDFTTWTDTALRMWISRAGTGNRPGPGVTEVETPEEEFGEGFFDGGFGGGGGGGGGFAGPTYVAPDRRVVEDFVKGSLVSLVGEVPDHLVGPTTDLYMSDHRRNFDSERAEIDPQQSVLERIRGTQEYQTIHQLRPESDDERSWIASRRSAAQQGGLTVKRQEQFAIDQATVAGDLDEVVDAAALSQFQHSGRAPTILDQKFRAAAQNMFANVRR
jgi:hypothetical protein